jgi:SAM-dependent methyltransferase
MTIAEFRAAGEELSRKAQVTGGLHKYFLKGVPRLYRCCQLFGLFSKPLGDVLEIGPFYGYVPFILRDKASSYIVLEGDDPVIYPLVPLYKEAAIDFSYIDLFEVFGPTHTAPHTLSLPDSSCDTVLCWETMEHFNFNPVKFVRELYRVLKPGGRVCITVPNRASLQSMFLLLSKKRQRIGVESYFTFEDYESGGKKAFFGFHWREYTPEELRHLFSHVGFEIGECGALTNFQQHEHVGVGRKIARILSQLVTSVLPQFGTNVYLVAIKPEKSA